MFRDCGGVTLPPADALSAHPQVVESDPDFCAWHFAGQYALLHQVISTVRTVQTIVADGLGQLAALCAADAIPLGTAVRWLDAALSQEFPEREALQYQRDFESGRSIVTIRAAGRTRHAETLLRRACTH